MMDKMNQIFALVTLGFIGTFVVGCKTKTEVLTPPPPSNPIQVSGTQLDPYNMAKIRIPEAIHGYHLGPYIDPQDSGIRHDGHRIARVERTAKWNISPSAPTAVPLGPVIAVADPAKQTAPLSAELENKIAQANSLITALMEQNDTLQSQLKEKDHAIQSLSNRISRIEDE
jgi:hypothetical protein